MVGKRLRLKYRDVVMKKPTTLDEKGEKDDGKKAIEK